MVSSSFACDRLPLLLKYPTEIDKNKIKAVINKYNLHLFIPDCKDLDLMRSLVFVMTTHFSVIIYLLPFLLL